MNKRNPHVWRVLYLLMLCGLLPAGNVGAQTAASSPSTTPDAPTGKPLAANSAAPPGRAALLRAALDKTPVRLDLQAQSLDAMLDALCKQAHCNVVVDDAPLLAQTDIKCDGTATDALDQIAGAFDYTWEASRFGGILLRKAFRNPLEHPQINVAELRRAAHDALTTLSAVSYDSFAPDSDWVHFIRDMAATFTPDQWQTLNSGRLAAPQLTAPQRAFGTRNILRRL